MSKRWWMVAGALLLLCAAAPGARAAQESLVTLTMGSEVPSGDYDPVAEPGVMAGLSGGYRVTEWLEAGVAFGYFRNAGARHDKQLNVLEPSTGNVVTITASEDWTVTSLGLYGKAYVFERGRLAPYLRAGAGTYSVRYNLDVSASTGSTTVGSNEQQSKFGTSGGLGVSYRVAGGTRLGVEASYHLVFARDTKVTFWTTGATLGFGPGGK